MCDCCLPRHLLEQRLVPPPRPPVGGGVLARVVGDHQLHQRVDTSPAFGVDAVGSRLILDRVLLAAQRRAYLPYECSAGQLRRRLDGGGRRIGVGKLDGSGATAEEARDPRDFAERRRKLAHVLARRPPPETAHVREARRGRHRAPTGSASSAKLALMNSLSTLSAT